LTPLIPYGRGEIFGKSGGFQQAGLGERLSILLSYFPFGGTTKHGTLVGHQPWWSRLNYANAQTFAMNRYDQGQPGDSFKLAIYAPIPRFIWFNKPSITDVGKEFNYLATGNYFSSSAPGFFAEAYWNGGYAMVFIACFYVGVLFCCFTYYSIKKMQNNELLFLPIIFLGIRMGFRPDGWFVAEYIGTPLIAIFTHLALTWFLQNPRELLLNSHPTSNRQKTKVGIK